MKYDVFQPVTEDMELPDGNFKADVIYASGTQLENQVVNRGFFLNYNSSSNPIIAVRIHKPNHLKALAQRLVHTMHWSATSKNYSQVEQVLTLLEKEGKLVLDEEKVHHEPSASANWMWINNWMDKQGILQRDTRRKIRHWFCDPATYPVAYPLNGNVVLTKKPSGNGYCVVLPTGHTIVYSTAKTIWLAMRDGGFDPYLPTHPTVGEYMGNKRWHYSRNHKLKIRGGGVEIGCQFVPKSAIEDFAKREGWSK